MRREVIKANIIVFIASFCTLVIELVAGRIMAPYVGVSLYTWTSIIGVVLAGISIGAYLGGLIADRYPRSSTLGWLLFLSGLGAFAICPLAHVVGKIYAFSTLGSILGTFATGFFLISWMGTRNILFAMGIILVLSGVVFGGLFTKKAVLAVM